MKPTILSADNSDARGPINPRAYVAKHLQGKHDQAMHNPSGDASKDEGDREAGMQVSDRLRRESDAVAADPSASPQDKKDALQRAQGAGEAVNLTDRAATDGYIVRAEQMLSGRRKLTPDQRRTIENQVEGAREVYQAKWPDAQF